jgi:hypothetical protein
MYLFISDINQVLFTRTKGSKNKRVKYRGQTYEISTPKRATQKGKKQQVTVRNISTGQTKTIAYGAKGYENYGYGKNTHRSEKRRNNYLTRSAGIRDKQGQLTKDNPMSPNYHARRQLW